MRKCPSNVQLETFIKFLLYSHFLRHFTNLIFLGCCKIEGIWWGIKWSSKNDITFDGIWGFFHFWVQYGIADNSRRVFNISESFMKLLNTSHDDTFFYVSELHNFSKWLGKNWINLKLKFFSFKILRLTEFMKISCKFWIKYFKFWS